MNPCVRTSMKKSHGSDWMRVALFLTLILELGAQTQFKLQYRLPLPEEITGGGIQPDLVRHGPGETFLLLDRQSKNIVRLTVDGGVTITGGFGQSEESLFDPVDMIVDQMTVYILDRGRDGWVQFDYQLRFLDFLPLKNGLDPYRFTKDSFGNVYVAGYSNQGIFRKTRVGWDPGPFVDFQYLTPTPEYIQLLETNPRGELAFISQNPDQLMVFSSTGRLLSQQSLNRPEQVKGLLYISGRWITARQVATGLVFQSGAEALATLPVDSVVSVIQAAQDVIVLNNKYIRKYQITK